MRSISSFEKIDIIGEGTYGVVHKAKDKDNGRVVALKKVKMEQEKDGVPLTSLREIQILKEIKHPNIVSLIEVVVGSTDDKIYLVFEYLEHDIASLIDNVSKPFKLSEIKCLLLQLLRSIEYLHSHWIIHRDLKCSNLLYGNNGNLKLADFGLARKIGLPIEPITPNVVTLWYRSPELLLGSERYSSAIDLWSIGCIFGELCIGRPLISANNELDQLFKIFNLLGDPNELIWPEFKSLPYSKRIKLPGQPYSCLKDKVPNLTENGYDLLNQLLTYDPLKRISAADALLHPFFSESPYPQSIDMMPSYPIIRDKVNSNHHHHHKSNNNDYDKYKSSSSNDNNHHTSYKSSSLSSTSKSTSSSSSSKSYNNNNNYRDKDYDDNYRPYSRYD